MIKHIGEENMVVFGRDPQDRVRGKVPEVEEVISADQDLRRVLDFLDEVARSERDGDGVGGLLATLRATDDFWVLRDFRDYVDKQHMIDQFYNDRIRWLKMSLTSIAKSGWFSIDRAVREHVEKIWRVAES
jgi:starch phosphorylase